MMGTLTEHSIAHCGVTYCMRSSSSQLSSGKLPSQYCVDLFPQSDLKLFTQTVCAIFFSPLAGFFRMFILKKLCVTLRKDSSKESLWYLLGRQNSHFPE